MNEWKKAGSKFIKSENGVDVVTNNTDKNSHGIFCCICKWASSGFENNQTMEQYGTCKRCAELWVYEDIEKWQAGIRPTQADLLRKSEFISALKEIHRMKHTKT